jgi:hypothetical protein
MEGCRFLCVRCHWVFRPGAKRAFEPAKGAQLAVLELRAGEVVRTV